MGLPSTKEELMQQIEKDWLALAEALDVLSTQQMSERRNNEGNGEWAIKDHVAHLTAWQQYLLRHHMGGEPLGEALGLDSDNAAALSVDEENELLFQRDKERPATELLAELRASHAEVVATLQGMTFDQLTQPRYPDRPDDGPLLAWVAGDTYEHYQEHLETIRQAGGAQ